MIHIASTIRLPGGALDGSSTMSAKSSMASSVISPLKTQGGLKHGDI